MPKKIKNLIKKYGLLIWMVVAILALVTTLSFAAWTRVKKVKRVVSIQSETGMRFSSNYMNAVTPVQTRNIAVGSEDSPTVEIVVRNHPQGIVSMVYPYDLSYTLKATLCDSDGNAVTSNDSSFSNYSIKTITDRLTLSYGPVYYFSATTVAGSTNYVATIPGNTLTGGITDEEYFLLTFDAGQKEVSTPTYYVKLEAILDEGGEDIEDLAGFVGLYSKSSRTGWSLTQADDTSKGIGEYHGFNYVLSGSGEGTVKISWNPNEVTISSLFLREVGAVIADDSQNAGMKCATLFVNSDVVNYYDVQFYKAADFDVSLWSAMVVGGNNVKCSYTGAVGLTLSSAGETVTGSITAESGNSVIVSVDEDIYYLTSVTLSGNVYSVLEGGTGYSVSETTDGSSNKVIAITIDGAGTINLTESGDGTVITFAPGTLSEGDNPFAIRFLQNNVIKVASGIINVSE